MINLSNLLHEPYPYYYEGKLFFKYLVCVFLLVFSFNYILEPFGSNVEELKISYFWNSFFHSLSPVLVLMLMALILNLVLKREAEKYENWNLKKEFLVLLFVFFLTGATQFLLRDTIYTTSNWSIKYLFEEVTNTLTGGFFLSFVVIPFNYFRLRLKNQEQASIISNQISTHKVQVEACHNLLIKTEQRSEDFLLDIGNFLFAQSEGNYIDFYLNENNETLKLVKRLRLKSLEFQLSGLPKLIKIHRSVIVNLNAIEKVSGNAQGYRIKLKNYPTTLPVSRSFIETFKSKLNDETHQNHSNKDFAIRHKKLSVVTFFF